MAKLFFVILFCGTVLLSACTMPFLAYVRNMVSTAAIVDVVLLDKRWMRTLPNSVLVADKIVPFKAGFRQCFYQRRNVHWIDTVHFSFTVLPGSTADLTDMAGMFMNGHPREDVFVTITINDTVDTLINGLRDFRHEKFGLKNVGISLPVYYYDVKN